MEYYDHYDSRNNCTKKLKKTKIVTTFTNIKGHVSNYLTGDIKCKFAFHLIDNNATIRIIKQTKIQLVKGMMAALLSF